MTGMTPPERSVAGTVRAEIADRIHLFYRLMDGGKAERAGNLFTSDARLTFGPGSPRPGTIEGHDISLAMAARQREHGTFTRHAISNLAFDDQGGGAISVTYLMVLFRSDDDTRDSVPAFVADVEDRWIIDGKDWNLAERTVSPAFSRTRP